MFETIVNNMINKNYDDWLLLEIETTVIEVIAKDDYFYHHLADTIFYYEGGGMSSDTGFINDERLLELVFDNGILWHKIAKQLNGKVILKVDKAPRVSKVQIHSASHLMCGIMNKVYHAKTIAFFTLEHMAGIEMGFETFNQEIMQEIEDKCNAYICDDLQIEIRYPTKEEAAQYTDEKRLEHDELRAAVIEGIDYNMCGCIHVPSLRYIQAIKFQGFERTTRGYRIYFICGNQLLETVGLQRTILSDTGKLLAVSSLEVYERVEALLLELKHQKSEINEYKQQIITFLAKELSHTADDIIVQEFSNMDVKTFQMLASLLLKTYQKNIAGILVLNDKCHVIITNNDNPAYNSNEVFIELRENYQLKGGGNRNMAQGGGAYNPQILTTLKDKFSKI